MVEQDPGYTWISYWGAREIRVIAPVALKDRIGPRTYIWLVIREDGRGPAVEVDAGSVSGNYGDLLGVEHPWRGAPTLGPLASWDSLNRAGQALFGDGADPPSKKYAGQLLSTARVCVARSPE
jgi:hypothetical protein